MTATDYDGRKDSIFLRRSGFSNGAGSSGTSIKRRVWQVPFAGAIECMPAHTHTADYYVVQKWRFRSTASSSTTWGCTHKKKKKVEYLFTLRQV